MLFVILRETDAIQNTDVSTLKKNMHEKFEFGVTSKGSWGRCKKHWIASMLRSTVS